MTTPIPTFGAILRRAREAAGVSQRDLADFLGVSAPYLSDVERDRRAPLRQDLADKAAARLGITRLSEVKARARSVGHFTLQADMDQTEAAAMAGALLSMAWPHLDEAAHQALIASSWEKLSAAGIKALDPPE